MPPTTHLLAKDDRSTGKKPLPSRQQSVTPSSSTSTPQLSPNAPSLMPGQVLSLQRSIGNQAVQRLLQSSRPATVTSNSSAPVIQRKLQVGPAQDRYEEEADRVAEQVVHQPQSTVPSLQRNEDEEVEEVDEAEEEDYEPTNKDIRKKMGLKFWLWKAAMHGALGMDKAKSKITGNRSTTFTPPVSRHAAISVQNAKGKLYQQHNERDLSRAERKQLRKERRQARQEMKKEWKAYKKEEHGIEV